MPFATAGEDSTVPPVVAVHFVAPVVASRRVDLGVVGADVDDAVRDRRRRDDVAPVVAVHLMAPVVASSAYTLWSSEPT